jgi:hypothetical protein
MKTGPNLCVSPAFKVSMEETNAIAAASKQLHSTYTEHIQYVDLLPVNQITSQRSESHCNIERFYNVKYFIIRVLYYS